MKKITTIILFFITLFIFSFLTQSKYNNTILNKFNVQNSESLFLKTVNVFGHNFIVMDLLTLSIVICFSIFIAILVFVLFNRRNLERKEKLKQELNVIYQNLILDVIQDKMIYQYEIKKFKKILNSRFKRNILINQIIDVALMMPDDKKGILKDLYFKLNLYKDTVRKLKNFHWHNKIKAMKELSHLGITEYNNTILKYVNSKNDTLRMEAQIAMIRLSGSEDSFNFLSHLTHNFSLWEQITLHQLIIQHNIKVPDFSKWIKSSNDSVVMFCLRMIKEFKQLTNQIYLEDVLNHKNEEVRKLCYQVMGDLNLVDFTIPIKKKYKYEELDNKLQIVKTLGKLSNPKSIEFLQKVVDSEDNTEIQIEATKAIKNMGDIGEVYLKKMISSDYKNYNIIIKHVLDNRIN